MNKKHFNTAAISAALFFGFGFPAFGALLNPSDIDPQYLADLTATAAGATNIIASGAGGHSSYPAWKAFDGNTTENSRWLAAKASTRDAWLTYTFPEPTQVNALRICASPNLSYDANRHPKAFTLEGSHDGAAWEPIGDESNLPSWTANEWRLFGFENRVAYTMYRYATTENINAGADYSTISELELLFIPPSGTSLLIQGLPADVGTVDPQYGTLANLESGTSIVCVASSTAERDGAFYQLDGHVLEDDNGYGAWTNPRTNLTAACAFSDDGNNHRLTWLWTPVAYALHAEPEGGSESVTRSAAPDANGYYPAGAAVTLTAHPATTAPASVFKRWRGDVPAGMETANPLTISMDRPRVIIPEFRREWIYQSGSPATITDGDWTLNVSGATALSITSVGVTGQSGVVDFTAPITGGRYVTEINHSVFYNNAIITKAILPETLVRIAYNAFRNCPSLTTIEPLLPASITALGETVFENSPVQGDLSLSNPALLALGSGIFRSTAIASADMTGSGIATISGAAFRYCASLTNVALSAQLQTIGANAFSDNPALAAITPLLPAPVSHIGNEAFARSPVRGDLVLSNPALFTISDKAFTYARIATADMTGSGITNIVGNAFRYCGSLASIALPPRLQSIGTESFADCAALAEISPFLPRTVVYIGNNAFKNSPVETPLILDPPSPTLTIQSEAFNNTRMASLYFGKHVTSIPGKAFSGNTTVTQVWFCGDVPAMSSNAFESWGDLQARFYVPKNTDTWKQYRDEKVTPLTPQEKLDFATLYPDEPLAYGKFVPPGTATYRREWFCHWTPPDHEALKTILLIK